MEDRRDLEVGDKVRIIGANNSDLIGKEDIIIRIKMGCVYLKNYVDFHVDHFFYRELKLLNQVLPIRSLRVNQTQIV